MSHQVVNYSFTSSGVLLLDTDPETLVDADANAIRLVYKPGTQFPYNFDKSYLDSDSDSSCAALCFLRDWNPWTLSERKRAHQDLIASMTLIAATPRSHVHLHDHQWEKQKRNGWDILIVPSQTIFYSNCNPNEELILKTRKSKGHAVYHYQNTRPLFLLDLSSPANVHRLALDPIRALWKVFNKNPVITPEIIERIGDAYQPGLALGFPWTLGDQGSTMRFQGINGANYSHAPYDFHFTNVQQLLPRISQMADGYWSERPDEIGLCSSSSGCIRVIKKNES